MADGRAALRAILIQEAPGKSPWIEDAYRSCWFKENDTGSKEGEWIGAILDGLRGETEEVVQYESVDLAMLSASSYLMWSEFSKASGWPTDKVLTRIADETKKRSSEQAIEKEGGTFKAWAKRVEEVLEDKKNCPPLLDEKSVGMRATLFLLLRGDIDSILDTDVNSEKGIKVGANVRLLAACLVAIRYGLRQLPSRYKVSHSRKKPRNWLAVLGGGIVSELDLRSVIDREIEIESPKQGRIEGKWRLLRKDRGAGEPLVLKPRDIDPGIERLITRARDLKYEIELHGDDGLKTSVKVNGDLQEVCLSIRQVDSTPPQRLVHFWAKAEDLSSRRGKDKDAWPTPKAKKMKTKKKMGDLLEQNAGKDLGCYFAIDSQEKALTVSICQLMSTMDDDEFCFHLNNVARRAAEYGKDQKRLKKR